jgi:hypothetical protein
MIRCAGSDFVSLVDRKRQAEHEGKDGKKARTTTRQGAVHRVTGEGCALKRVQRKAKTDKKAQGTGKIFELRLN